jgi:hypothetical protein
MRDRRALGKLHRWIDLKEFAAYKIEESIAILLLQSSSDVSSGAAMVHVLKGERQRSGNAIARLGTRPHGRMT